MTADPSLIRVLVVDDHSPINKSFARLVQYEEDMEIAGVAASSEEAIVKYERLRPDVVIFNLCKPGIGGITATREICRRHPDARVMILIEDQPDNRKAALEAGAYCFMSERPRAEEVIKAVHEGAQGRKKDEGLNNQPVHNGKIPLKELMLKEGILVSCSAKKDPSGGAEYAPSSQLKEFLLPQTYRRLMAARREITEKLLVYPEFVHKKYLSPGPDLGFEERTDGVLYLPAFERYTGRVFKTANIRELYQPAHRGSILIFSGLYGLTEPQELIRDYNVMMSDSCDIGKPVWRFWIEHGLGSVTTEYLRNTGCELCHDLLASGYRKAMFSWPRKEAGFETRTYSFPGRGNAADFDRGKILKGFLEDQWGKVIIPAASPETGTPLSLLSGMLKELEGFLDKVRIRLLIVDDHPPTRKRLALIIKKTPDVTVAGMARTGEEGVRMYAELQPDVVSMDINMPGMNGITATQEIRSWFPDARIFIHSVQDEKDYRQRAEMAGVYSYLVAPASPEVLIRTVLEGAPREKYEIGPLLDNLLSFYHRLVDGMIIPDLESGFINERLREETRILTRKMLEILDSSRQAWLIRFLQASGLLQTLNPYMSLSGADLSGIELPAADLAGCNLNGVNLGFANLTCAHLERARLVGIQAESIRLNGAFLQGASLAQSIFDHADFRGAQMAGADLRFIWCGSRFQTASFEGADLSGADLRGGNIQDVKFTGANLRGADLRGAALKDSTLEGADISWARGIP